jgi:hypothetical protein
VLTLNLDLNKAAAASAIPVSYSYYSASLSAAQRHAIPVPCVPSVHSPGTIIHGSVCSRQL